MKTALQAANDLLHVMTEVGQADCYLDDMRLIVAELTKHKEQCMPPDFGCSIPYPDGIRQLRAALVAARLFIVGEALPTKQQALKMIDVALSKQIPE